MNSIKTLYKLMEVSSRDLEIPDAYQRKLNTERVAKIVAGFNERIANEPKVSFRDGHYYVFDGQHTIVARKHMNGKIHKRFQQQLLLPRINQLFPPGSSSDQMNQNQYS